MIKKLTVDYAGPSDLVVKISNELREQFEKRLESGIDYSSLLLMGGAGFGDFDPQVSDIDLWLVFPDMSPSERLEKVAELNNSFKEIKSSLIAENNLTLNNFRHPPTYLSEKEARWYQKSFAAKIGLPISLGIFPVLSGWPREKEYYFSDSQLKGDIAYSCWVFMNNFLHPPDNQVEDQVRYCYKRATYFLRFILIYEKDLYVPRQDRLLEMGENYLPEWRNAISLMRQVFEGNGSKPEMDVFNNAVGEIMKRELVKFQTAGLIDELSLLKGSTRTRLCWTMEKLRWDYLQISDKTMALKKWAYDSEQINSLFVDFFHLVKQSDFMNEWVEFQAEISQYSDNPNELYYQKMSIFFDRAMEFVDDLF